MGLTANPCLATVLLQSHIYNMAKVICLLAWAGLASAAPQRTILLGGRDSSSLNTGSVVDTILAQLDTPINNAIQAALSGLYSSKAVSSSPVETSFTSVVSQAPAITVQTSGTFSSAEEGDSSSFTSNTVSDDSASFFSSSLQSSQDSNSFFSSNSFQGSSSSGSVEDSYVPLTTFTDSSSTSGSDSGFNSGTSSGTSSSTSSSSTDGSSLVSQVVGELGPQIDEAVRAALAALKSTTTTTTTTETPEPAPTTVTSVTSVVEEE